MLMDQGFFFKMLKGLKHGCLLSPMHFIIVLNRIIKLAIYNDLLQGLGNPKRWEVSNLHFASLMMEEILNVRRIFGLVTIPSLLCSLVYFHLWGI